MRTTRILAVLVATAGLILFGCGDDDGGTEALDDSRTDACEDLVAVIGLPSVVDPSEGYAGLVEAVPDDAPADVRAALDRLESDVGAAVAAPSADPDVSDAIETLARYLSCGDLVGGS